MQVPAMPEVASLLVKVIGSAWLYHPLASGPLVAAAFATVGAVAS